VTNQTKENIIMKLKIGGVYPVKKDLIAGNRYGADVFVKQMEGISEVTVEYITSKGGIKVKESS
jgi:hypothetical protein